MTDTDMALTAHLMRRAGFGATRDELEAYVAKGYEATIEELLHPESAPPALEDEDIIRRYHVDENDFVQIQSCQTYWVYRMINTRRPLEEKIALFWHHVFATGNAKINNPRAVLKQIAMFRASGLGSFRTLLLQLSKSPAMIFWLDNKDNHMGAVNENFGRELLELFSMGVGNYTEDDVKQASRAFTGWTIRSESMMSARSRQDLVLPYGYLDWLFEYKDEDHDGGTKRFLGHEGAFKGEDVIDIICQNPATARFVARHLYNFFVADEPQVPAWETVPPRDPEAISALAEAFVQNGYEIRSVLRVLFNSDFFKNAQFDKIKSPAELVVGTARMAGGHSFPDLSDVNLGGLTGIMGQSLLDPPSVEGWHTGPEWITTGSLADRVNYASEQFADAARPGVRAIISRVQAQWDGQSPQELVDACLDQIGPIIVSQDTRRELVDHAADNGDSASTTGGATLAPADRIKEMLQLIVAIPEYQVA